MIKLIIRECWRKGSRAGGAADLEQCHVIGSGLIDIKQMAILSTTEKYVYCLQLTSILVPIL